MHWHTQPDSLVDRRSRASERNHAIPERHNQPGPIDQDLVALVVPGDVIHLVYDLDRLHAGDLVDEDLALTGRPQSRVNGDREWKNQMDPLFEFEELIGGDLIRPDGAPHQPQSLGIARNKPTDRLANDRGRVWRPVGRSLTGQSNWERSSCHRASPP